jgi:hypothetical protein
MVFGMAICICSGHIVGWCIGIRGFGSGSCGEVLDDWVMGLTCRLICELFSHGWKKFKLQLGFEFKPKL